MNTINTTTQSQQFQTTSSNDEEIDLVQLLNQLIANKWLILLVTLIALGVGYIVAHQKVKQYQADVMLQVDVIRPGFGQGGGAAAFALGAGLSNASAETQIVLIKSRVILDPVIESLGLDINVKPMPLSFWKRPFQKQIKKNGIRVQSFELPKNKLNKRYQLVVDKPGHISLYDWKKNLILQGVQGKLLTSSDKTIHLMIKSIKAQVGQRFILTKLAKAKVAQSLNSHLIVKEAEGNSSRFMAGTGILYLTLTGDDPLQVVQTLNAIANTAKNKDIKKKSQEASQTLTFLKQQLPITKGELEKAEFSLNQYRAKSGKIDDKLQTQALVQQFSELDKELSKLRVEKINMQQEYTSKHPKLIAMNTQLRSLEAQRSKLEQSFKILPASDQIAVNLLMDVKVKKTLYLMLLHRIQELHVVKAGMLSGIRILAMAKLPDRALPTERIATYISSVFCGLLISIMIIFSLRLFSRKINDPHWGEQKFNLPNLAIIPFCKEQKMLDKNVGIEKKASLLAFINPRNLSIESLRSLRTSLQIALAGSRNNRVSILGVSPGIGKSFVSANLAYLLASAGKKVLIIDADLRRGTIHKYMGIPPSPGLAEVLNGSVSIETALATTMSENLTCLPRGSYPNDPSELLMSSRLEALMDELSSRYDVVIIDTAPILLVTDALLVAGLSGTNYIVFGAGIHEPAEIEMALKRLRGAGVNLHGSIFNFQRQQSKKTYQGQYKYYEYYDESMKLKS